MIHSCHYVTNVFGSEWRYLKNEWVNTDNGARRISKHVK